MVVDDVAAQVGGYEVVLPSARWSDSHYHEWNVAETYSQGNGQKYLLTTESKKCSAFQSLLMGSQKWSRMMLSPCL
jgi:hypothetical protein